MSVKAPSAVSWPLGEPRVPEAGADARRARADSVAWRVNAERIVLAGWSRAILLQLAHPLVAAGVFDHSGFRGSPWAAAARLHHTVHAMLSLTFGDEASQARALDGIRAIHRRVHGVLAEPVGPYPAGTPYSAEDPALVLWVHATLVESIVITYERFVAPLDAAERDAYCVETAPLAVALAARDEEVPRSWAGTRDYLDRSYASSTIVVGRQARELARAVLRPAGTRLLAPAAWVHELVTAGLLPPSIREEYGIGWTAGRQRRFERVASGLAAVRRLMPAAVALWPASRVRRGGRG